MGMQGTSQKDEQQRKPPLNKSWGGGRSGLLLLHHLPLGAHPSDPKLPPFSKSMHLMESIGLLIPFLVFAQPGTGVNLQRLEFISLYPRPILDLIEGAAWGGGAAGFVHLASVLSPLSLPPSRNSSLRGPKAEPRSPPL